MKGQGNTAVLLLAPKTGRPPEGMGGLLYSGNPILNVAVFQKEIVNHTITHYDAGGLKVQERREFRTGPGSDSFSGQHVGKSDCDLP